MQTFLKCSNDRIRSNLTFLSTRGYFSFCFFRFLNLQCIECISLDSRSGTAYWISWLAIQAGLWLIN